MEQSGYACAGPEGGALMKALEHLGGYYPNASGGAGLEELRANWTEARKPCSTRWRGR